jgi:hypothetical protein
MDFAARIGGKDDFDMVEPSATSRRSLMRDEAQS